MSFGWTGKTLVVDLTAGRVSPRDTMPYTREWVGGRAMAMRMLWEETPASADPFSPENVIVVATGPLTGTLAPTAGRTVMAGLSPRTYPLPWPTHSTLGGWFGPALKYAGLDAVLIRGRGDSPVYLDIRDNDVSLVDARDLWGMDARQVQLSLKARLGNDTQVLTIGPAGENLVRFATVQHSEENASGHSGFGAVWGSKQLKAIAVRGSGGVAVADPAALLREVLRIGKFTATPCHSALLGEAQLRKRKPICSQACTFNCNAGEFGETENGRLVPGHCIGRAWLGNWAMRKTRYSGGGVEVPPSVNFSPHREASLHELCNGLGLDLWFRLVMQPWLIRCQQLDVQEVRGHQVDPVDSEWFGHFMHQMAFRQGLGAVFADGLRRAMDELEEELPTELVTLGRELEFGFGFPAHREGRFWDEEPLPFWVISAMMYASESRDPTIGTHQSSLLLAEFLLADRELALRHFRDLSEKVWGYPDALEPGFERKAPVAIWSQHQHILLDSLTMCDLAFPQLVRPLSSLEEWRAVEEIAGDLDIGRRLLAAVTGVDFTPQQLDRVAERAFTLERVMLARAGRSREMEEGLAPHFKLPCRADGTMVDEVGFSRLLDEYYEARGWDRRFGWPEDPLLKRLGLEEAIPELERCRQERDGAAQGTVR